MTSKQPDFSELNQMAVEACDMWQEHLSTLATDANARAELTRFLEPQRRLFADWASMMQQGQPGAKQPTGTEAKNDSSRTQSQPANAPKQETAPPPSPASASRGAAHGDDALRVAQLALRVAELEKRLSELESKPAGARKTQRTTS